MELKISLKLTNKFEEVIQMNKLTTLQIQSDTQLDFLILKVEQLQKKEQTLLQVSKPQILVQTGYSTNNLPNEQSINSIESAKTVIAEELKKESTE